MPKKSRKKTKQRMSKNTVSEKYLRKLNKLYSSLTPDPKRNIKKIVDAAGKLLGGACMLYNRFEKERGILCTWAIWNAPPKYKTEDSPAGHICYDVVEIGKMQPRIIEDLTKTKYVKTDPNVKKYKLKSYLGFPVSLRGEVVGSFCLCDTKRRKFTEEEISLVSMFSKLIATEEERKLVLDELHKTSESLILSQKAANMGSWDWNIVDDELKCSDNFFKLFGLSKNTVWTDISDWLERIHPEDKAEAKAAVMEAVENGKKYEDEYRIILPNGKLRWITGKGKVICDKKVRPVRMVGISYDITGLKKAEESLKRSEAFLESVGKMAKVGGWEVDAETRKVKWTKEIYKIHEIPFDQKISLKKAVSFFLPDDRTKLQNSIEAALKQGKPYDLELRLITAKGNELWTHTICKPVVKKGKLIKLFGTFQDITDLKETEKELLKEKEHALKLAEEQRRSYRISMSIMEDMEAVKSQLETKIQELENTRMATMHLLKDVNDSREALRKAHNDLEVKVKERTKELHEANIHLQELDKMKSDFIASMSHELRTPLNSIIGFSEVLYDETFGPLNEKQKDYTNDVLESGKHLLSLINDILDLSKIEAGKLSLSLRKVDLKHVLESCLTMIKEKALKHSLKIKSQIDDLGIVEADERKIKQIVINLLSNATKFTPDGGEIGIRAKRADDHVEVAVWDTGIGLEKQNLDKIFKEFTQVDSDYTRKEPGTGLGLSLAKRLVDLHKGKIWAESEGPNKGSTFKFSIPLNGGAKEDENGREEKDTHN